jgi:hypothetical protein
MVTQYKFYLIHATFGNTIPVGFVRFRHNIKLDGRLGIGFSEDLYGPRKFRRFFWALSFLFDVGDEVLWCGTEVVHGITQKSPRNRLTVSP